MLETLQAGGYDELQPRATSYEVFGMRIQAAALEDIIVSKAASDRPKDRLQLEVLRQLARERARSRDADPPAQ